MKWCWWAFSIAFLGCGSAQRVPTKAELVPDATSELLAAVSRHDDAAITAMFDEKLVYAGMYFGDPACAQQFPVPRVIPVAQYGAFARCLASMPLREANRTDPTFGAAVLDYDPGVELEAVFRFPHGRAKLAWIGYSGRRTGTNALPTVTPAALEAHLIEGDKAAAPTADAARAIEAENKLLALHGSYAWMKVCIDAEGTVTGAHTIETTSPAAEAAFIAAMQRWKFRPFTFGTQATPVCSLIYLDYPASPPREGKDQLPIAFTPPAGALRIPEAQLRRVSGMTQVMPDDGDKVRLQRSGGDELVGAFWYCFDTTGTVIDVGTVEATGLPGYDAKIVAAIRAWKFRPYVLDGVPRKGCSAVNFVYHQG